MNYSTLNFKEIRSIYKDRYPDKPIGGKGISKQFLIDELTKGDNISTNASADQIKHYYKTQLTDEITFAILEEAINKVPNPNNFSTLWSHDNWNSDNAWLEYHRELMLIGNDEVDSNIYQFLQNSTEKLSIDMKKSISTFASKYPIATWISAYINKGFALYALISIVTKIEDILPFKENIRKYMLNSSTIPEINHYLLEEYEKNNNTRKIYLQKLLDTNIIGPRLTIKHGKKQYIIPMAGDIIYTSMFDMVYYLVVNVYIEQPFVKSYLLVVILKQKGMDTGLSPAFIKSGNDLELSNDLTYRRLYLNKFVYGFTYTIFDK